MNKVIFSLLISLLILQQIETKDTPSLRSLQSTIVNVTDETFNQEVMESEITKVVVYFLADWCSPCKMQDPAFNQLSAELTEIKFVRINIDENPQTLSTFQVINFPTMIIFSGGEEYARSVGVKSKSQLQNFLLS